MCYVSEKNPLQFMLQLFGLSAFQIFEWFLQSPILALSLPALQFTLIPYAGPFISTFISVTLALVLPCLRLSGSETHNPLFMVLFLASALRMWDFGILPKAIIMDMSWLECTTYQLSFQLPDRIQIAMSEAKNVTKHAVSYDDQTVKYIRNEVIKSILKATAYILLVMYLKINRPVWNPPVFKLTDMSDFQLVFEMFSMGLVLSLLMEATCTMMGLFYCVTLRIPYMPMMNQPYLATSIRDFWGCRWNMIVQRSLRRIVFDPVIQMLGVQYPIKPGQSIPFWKLTVAGFATFVFSGLMHEWTMVAIMEQKTTWEEFWFFTLHGALYILETMFRKLFKIILGIDLAKTIPYPIQWLYAQLLLVWTAPLFLNPYIREQIYFKYSW